MKKRIFCILMCICLILSVFSISCFATDEDVADVPITEESENGTESPVADEETAPDVFTRIYEFWEAHEAEIITVASSVVLIILNILSRISNNTLSKSQNDTIGGVNQLIEGYNTFSDAFEKIRVDFAEVVKTTKQINSHLMNAMNEVVATIAELKSSDASFADKITQTNAVIQELVEKEMLQNNALMEVLSSVYVNSKALPQGVKDLVVMKRTENMRIVEEANEIAHPHHNNVDGGKNDV